MSEKASLPTSNSSTYSLLILQSESPEFSQPDLSPVRPVYMSEEEAACLCGHLGQYISDPSGPLLPRLSVMYYRGGG